MSNPSNTYPFVTAYTVAYQNVSGQALYIDDGLQISPGHMWSPMTSGSYLSADQAQQIGAATQILIDRGYIKKTLAVPVIGEGGLYLQSIGGTWFQVVAQEAGSGNDKDSLGWELVCVTAPPDGSIINYGISLPSQTPFLIELPEQFVDSNSGLVQNYVLSAKFDFTIESLVFSKVTPGGYLRLPMALSVPNNVYFVIKSPSGSNVYLRLSVKDSGEVYFESITEELVLF